MIAWIGVGLSVLTAVTALIGFVALLARASNATAKIEGLIQDIAIRDNRIEELKARLAESETARLALKEQVSVLDERVTQRARVDDLAAEVAKHHRDVADRLVQLHQDVRAITSKFEKLLARYNTSEDKL